MLYVAYALSSSSTSDHELGSGVESFAGVRFLYVFSGIDIDSAEDFRRSSLLGECEGELSITGWIGSTSRVGVLESLLPGITTRKRVSNVVMF